MRVFVLGIGIISPLGRGRQATRTALAHGRSAIRPVRLFPVFQQEPLPVGEIFEFIENQAIPRTHALALLAAQEAVAGVSEPPDAVLLGVASGGMPATETLLKQSVSDPARYRDHAVGSVAAHVARAVGCRGPVMTVSTACSSGSVALAIAMEMLRSGGVRTVLAGGADALCRMTYYGFHALQLVDAAGARPLDRKRRGMTVGEGAAWLLLGAAQEPPEGALAELLGAGLSCDAYHPAAPQPEGVGALQAMQGALADAGIDASQVDYIHLHGTGTADNDLAEARALDTLFGPRMPAVSSTKGATGHTPGAAGALGAAIAVIGIGEGLVPANTACQNPDPELKLQPVLSPLRKSIGKVLVNAFGFGGNNASLLIGKPVPSGARPAQADMPSFAVTGMSCLSGAGGAEATMARLFAGAPITGVPDLDASTAHLPQRLVRRLKRLPRMVLALAAACTGSQTSEAPHAVFFGTGWGPLSEAHDFLMKLFESGEQFCSPTDFIGAVHNAPAGQAAIYLRATGPNITLSGGNYSFEQALLTAGLFRYRSSRPLLVIGADEHHPVFTPLFEPAAAAAGTAADGGAAFLLTPGPAAGMRMRALSLSYAAGHDETVSDLMDCLGGKGKISDRYAAVFAGVPASCAKEGRRQLEAFLAAAGFDGPVIDYRRWTGEFASASAIGAFLAASCVRRNEIPGPLRGAEHYPLSGRGILLLGLGEFVTAVEVVP